MPTSPAETTRPLRADARRNRERVLDAARECFAEQGMEAQVDDIAAVAGVGVGTVYRHFPTKDVLIEALANEYFGKQLESTRAALSADDPWEGFCGFVRRGAAMFAANRVLGQLSADRPNLMEAAAMRADAEHGLFTLLDELITRAKRAGRLRADFELEDVPMIMCSLGSLQIGDQAYVNWDRLLEIVIDGLRAPGCSPLPALQARIERVGSPR